MGIQGAMPQIANLEIADLIYRHRFTTCRHFTGFMGLVFFLGVLMMKATTSSIENGHDFEFSRWLYPANCIQDHPSVAIWTAPV